MLSENTFRLIQVVLGAAGLVLLFFYVRYTLGLLSSSQKQVRNLSDALQVARDDLWFRTRPWLGIEDIDPLDEKKRSVWIIKVRNYGAGPASVHLEFVVREVRSDGWAKDWEGQTPTITIFPGQTQRIAVEIDDALVQDLLSEEADFHWDLRLPYAWGAAEKDEIRQLRRWVRRDGAWAI